MRRRADRSAASASSTSPTGPAATASRPATASSSRPIANQIGAAIENVRLAERDRQQQRVRRELELAHDLQLRLLPSPAVLYGEAKVAARCTPVDSVGGDFYTFSRLGQGRVGVMLGDVSSHGFGAALVMALVLSAAGIHVETIGSPEATLDALLDSVGDELRSAEMYFTVFYGVLDRRAGTLRMPAPVIRTPSAFPAWANRSGCSRPARRSAWRCRA